MSLIIRQVQQGDFQVWSDLWRDYLAFYETEKPAEIHALGWKRIMDPGEKMHSVLAFDGDRAVGLANYLFHRSFWEAEDKCYLNDLFVRPESRGKGAGRALIESVAQEAKTADASQLWWFTAENNLTARRLYDSLATRSEFVEYYR